MRHVAMIYRMNCLLVRMRLNVHMVCEREESRFIFVSATCFSLVPIAMTSMPSFSEEICFSWRGENLEQDYSEVDDVEEPVRIGTGIQHRLALAHADRRREQIIDAILIIFQKTHL